MTDTIIKNARLILPMTSVGATLAGCDIRITHNRIAEIGPDLAGDTASIINAAGCVVTPGLVNTHHHLYQSMTRAVPAAQNAALFGWLQTLYPIWAKMQPDDFHTSAGLGMAELLLSGCTMTSDHLYLYPNGARLDDTIYAAQDIGMRFHATRGAMSIGESDGGLPPDHLVEREPDILDDMIRVIDQFHDNAGDAMVQVAVAPCSPFSVSRELMRDAAILARDKGVMMHTHLAENEEDIAFSLENFGCRPGEYAQDLGWVGDDVWHAHCVKLDTQEIDLFARTKTGVAHCPCSNCRLASGIAPVRHMRDAGVPVGLGVDGSASNDAGNIVAEARQTMLLQRVGFGPGAMSAQEALFIATKGGADVLNRADCGEIAVGKCADLAVWDVSGVDAAGNWDPSAFLLAGPTKPRDVLVNGQHVVAGGRLTTVDQDALVKRHNAAVVQLMNRAGY